MIKYSYAKNDKNEIVDARALVKDEIGLTPNFFCLSCNRELIPKLGKVRAKHFAHKGKLLCSKETYLHNLGKNLFYNEYNKCLSEKIPFYIELYRDEVCSRRKKQFNLSCYLGRSLFKFDLTRYFNHIKLENREGSFIPDVLLIDTFRNEKIFFEISVTHISTETKINSGYRLIELSVNDEADLEIIKNHSIREDNQKVRFKNFNKRDIIEHSCEDTCKNNFDFFRIDNNGSSRLMQKSLSEISSILQGDRGAIIYYEVSKSNDKSALKYKYLVSTAFLNKKGVKNCFICRHRSSNMRSQNEKFPIYCALLAKECNSNEAASCQCFNPEKEYVNRFIREWNNILRDSNDEFKERH